jgi:hypothetical protein
MKTKALLDFCEAVDATALSQAIQAAKWVVPLVQTIHILAIAALLSSVLMINLRLLGANSRDQTLARVCARFRPVVWWSLPVLLVSGLILIIGEPARSLTNPFFQLKMGLLITVLIVTVLSQRPLNRDTAFWDDRVAIGRAVAILSLLLWSGIVFAGRWIAYL